MPNKRGKFTGQEATFVAAMAETGSTAFARHAAKYKSTGSVAAVMQRPAVAAAIREREMAVITNDLLPLSNQVLRIALTEDRVPWGAKMKAVDIVHRRAFGDAEAGSGKSPSEMSPDELGAALDKLKRELSERATPIIEAEPIEQEDGPTVDVMS